ncbi:MAG: ABC transporter permease [Bacilli bacterium]
MFSEEHKNYLTKLKRGKAIVITSRLLIAISFIIIWELLSRFNIINTFLTSSPYEIFKTIVNLIKVNGLFNHILITTYEIFISFTLSLIIGFIIASVLWSNKLIADIIDPYLTILNSLPKVALGPLIIIWIGANRGSIIFMALLISTIITIISLYNSFINTDSNLITLVKSFKANKLKIYLNVIIPSNINNIISILKVNISMCLIGVIMGELLVSKEGLGYLIMYGSQVFNLNLVMASIFLLATLSYIMYEIVSLIEKKLTIKN